LRKGKKMKVKLVLCAAILASVYGLVAAEQKYSYSDLLNMLVDMERLAIVPQAGETTQQWSSYDRTSYYDEKTGKYVGWDHNGDGFGGTGWLREEGDKLVLGEMNGPGCIWRIWSANPKAGHIRIYLDGNETPVIDLPFTGYFDGKTPPFNRSALVYKTAAQGMNNYTPIPFQKSCKIVADRDYGEFHHFNYTLFTKDTIVPTFKMELSDEESAALDKVNQTLADCKADLNAERYPTAKKQTVSYNAVPGQSSSVIKLQGARAITSLKVSCPDLPADIEQQRAIMRQLVISIYWDGSKEPAVWCPLGDFFGTAPGINMYKSIAMGMTSEGFYSNWFMPFGKEAIVKITNDGDKAVNINFEITHTALSQPVKKYTRFHAKWHRNAFLPSEPERWLDWTILTTKGKGRFVGTSLEVWNPRGNWWGEGDEKFFVDGEKFPSTYGTGSEDYFGYAWSDAAYFQQAYHNQPINENNAGHASNNRWHISDSIPFQTSFDGYIEKFFKDERPTLYSCVAYWYLATGGQDPYKPVDMKDRLGWYVTLQFPREIAGMEVLGISAGNIEAQGTHGFSAAKWSDNDHLWWTAELGAKLRIAVSVEKDGRYSILTRMTKAPDYGIVQWYLNDQKIGEPIDLFNAADVTATDEINLGAYALKKGQNIFTVEIVGSNPEAIKRYMAGIDYIKVK